MSARTLWAARAGILDIYGRTPYFAPAVTRYGQELATRLSRTNMYLPLPMIRDLVMRFAASDRADLVDLVAAKLSAADRQEVIYAAALARHPELSRTLGNKRKPLCGGRQARTSTNRKARKGEELSRGSWICLSIPAVQRSLLDALSSADART